MIADGAGRAIAFRIAPGQAHELPHALPLLEQLPSVPGTVRNSVCGRRVEHQAAMARVKRSPKMTANC
ncbi:hypothetical protein SAMN02799627_06014, partial [Methylobacterium sp. 13MFTsu3.1M2]